MWPPCATSLLAGMEAVAHTLAYEALSWAGQRASRRLWPDHPAHPRAHRREQPRVDDQRGKGVAATVPRAVQRVLEDQTHNVAPQSLAPELLEFFIAV